MLKLGIRTGKVRTPGETAAPPGETSGEHPKLPVREQQRGRGQASRPDDFLVTGAGEPYLARHAADVAETPLDSRELPTGLRTGRHRH